MRTYQLSDNSRTLRTRIRSAIDIYQGLSVMDAYSAIASPDPPKSAGKSLSFGSPSFIGSTVSA